MTSIASDTVKNLYYANVIFELHQTKDKMMLLEKNIIKILSHLKRE